MENRLIELETKISYQEHLLQELSDVIAGQQQQIDKLEKELRRVREHLKGTGSQLARPEEEAPPPHY